MFQGFISKFTKNNLVKTAAAACIAASMAFADKAQIGTSSTYWELAGGVLTISGTGAMPTNFTFTGGNNPWYAQRASITSVVIEDGVTTIGQYAFSGCTGLTSVTIPNSVTSIGLQAFDNCTGLTSVTIPNSVTSIGTAAFSGCKGLTSVTIPASVTSIGQQAFSGCTGLTSVTIPASVTSIGGSAFSGCTGLTSVTIPNSVTSIGSTAFQNCTGLTAINVDENNANYASADGVLFNKAKTTLITYPAGKTGAYTIPASVTSIGGNAFYNCTGLTAINVDESNANYASDNGVLFNKAKTTLIQYPAAKTGAYTIPASVESIGTYAFYNCTGLTGALTIPASVKSIGDYAFSSCTGLTSVTIPASVTSIGQQAFNGCTGLTSVTIGNSVASIGSQAFSGCTGLTSVTIGNSVTSIGDYAFQNCKGLTSVTIPASVTTIGGSAFRGCTGLKHIVNRAAAPQTISNYSQFNGVTLAEVNLFVPASAIDAYKAAGVWKDFKNIASLSIATPTFTPATPSLVYTGGEQVGGTIAEGLQYEISGTKGTAAGKHTAKVALVSGCEWEGGTTDDLAFDWTIAKATATAPTGLTARIGQKLSDVPLSTGWTWVTPATVIAAPAGDQMHKAKFTPTDVANYNVLENIDVKVTVSVGKANPTAPTGLTARIGQKLENVSLPNGWSWMNPATVIAAPLGEQTHKAKFAGDNNYNAVENVEVKITVSAAATPIREIQKSDGRTGIRLSKNVVSDKAEFEVILPSDKVLEVKAVIYDNTGNVVFEKIERGAKLSWNLTNISGRNVANGTYLIIVEAKGVNGNYAYSAKVGVKK